MDAKLINRCEAFMRAHDEIKKAFSLESTQLFPVCASIFVTKGIEVSSKRLEECKKLIYDNTKLFSGFRGMIKMPVACLLATYDDPDEHMKTIVRTYDRIKKILNDSDQTKLAAALLLDTMTEEELVNSAERAKTIYKLMRKKHPIATGSEDIMFAILLANSAKSDDELIEEMENCLDNLKKSFKESVDTLQTISHILTLADGDWQEKCAKMREIFDAFAANGKKYGKYYQLNALATAAAIPVDTEKFVGDTVEIDNWLAEQKPYKGLLGIDKKNRLMHASMLTLSNFESNVNSAAIVSTVTMLIVEQLIVLSVIATTTASSSSN